MTTHQPDKSRLPQALQSLDWRPIQPGLRWPSGTVLLVAVAYGKDALAPLGDDWRYGFACVTIGYNDDEFPVTGHRDTWDCEVFDADWYVVISE